MAIRPSGYQLAGHAARRDRGAGVHLGRNPASGLPLRHAPTADPWRPASLAPRVALTGLSDQPERQASVVGWGTVQVLAQQRFHDQVRLSLLESSGAEKFIRCSCGNLVTRNVWEFELGLK